MPPAPLLSPAATGPYVTLAASRAYSALQPALTKAQQARPGEDVLEEARLKMRERLAAGGWLTEEGALHIKNNGCWFATASKQG